MVQFSRLVICSVVVGLFGPSATPAQAQGFLQSLFGGGQPVQQRTMPPRRGYNGSRYMPQSQSIPWWQYGQSYQRPRYRSYTAMCVRLCDGYYWPISNRVTRNKFYDLAQQCEQSCEGDAKLFYMPTQGGDVKQMTDLSGRAYEHIDNAFLYRKKLVKSCTCKPMPWSYRAKAKHMKYAAVEAEKRLRLEQSKRRQKDARISQHGPKQPQRQNDRRASGRTIIESLDDDLEGETEVLSEDVTYAEDEGSETGRETVDEVSNRRRRTVHRRKNSVIRYRRVRRYYPPRVRRRNVDSGWNIGFGG